MVTHSYDGLHRRTGCESDGQVLSASRQRVAGESSVPCQKYAYVLSSERRYLYDGWNLMAEIVASPTPFARTYVWGLDLSGSEQGAGGVGGLLAIQEGGESHYPVYDGNGNVMALVRGSDEEISGRYHYGAFGEVLEVEETGISNPFRFSTKFEDGETGLLYYGFRYYQPESRGSFG